MRFLPALLLLVVLLPAAACKKDPAFPPSAQYLNRMAGTWTFRHSYYSWQNSNGRRRDTLLADTTVTITALNDTTLRIGLQTLTYRPDAAANQATIIFSDTYPYYGSGLYLLYDTGTDSLNFQKGFAGQGGGYMDGYHRR